MARTEADDGEVGAITLKEKVRRDSSVLSR